MRIQSLAATAALALLVGCVAGDGSSFQIPTAPGHLTLADGSVVEGSVVATDVDGVTFDAGGTTQTFARTELDPVSWYLARSSDGGLTAADRLDLARQAMDHGLFHAAEVEVARVVELDESFEDDAVLTLEKGREDYAAQLTQQSDVALSSGDRRSARRLAGRVLTEFPDTEAATTAQGLVERMHAEIGEPENSESNLRLVSSRTADKRLAAAEKYVTRGEKRNLSALQKSGSSAKQSFENAIKDYAKAIAEYDKVLGDGKAAADVKLRAQQAREKAVASSVDAHIDLASFYMHRGSYPQSEEIANDALKLDPESQRAKQMVAKAEFVSAESARVRKLARKRGRNWRYDPNG